MRVLITGHRGFIGRHLADACRRRGDQVMGLDIKPGGLIDGSVRDCRDLFRDPWRFPLPEAREHFDVVFHCAATVGGRVGIDGDPLGVATNLSLDAEMFAWAARVRPGRVVYFSSSAAYPVALQQELGLAGQWRRLIEGDINADWCGRPDQTYGWAKLTGEILAEHLTAWGVPVHVFRPFSGYGSDQGADYPFGAFIARAVARADPFTVWGDGGQVRDWINIHDIVAAVFAAIERDERGPVNLCTGHGVSLSELARQVTAIAGYRPQFRYLTDKPTGVRYRVGDPTRMHRFHTPTVTLADGIRRGLAAAGAAATVAV